MRKSEKDLTEKIGVFLSEDTERSGGMFLDHEELLLCKIALELSDAVTQDSKAKKKLSQKEKAAQYDVLRSQFMKLAIQFKDRADDEYMSMGNMGALSRTDAVKYGRMKAYREIERDIRNNLEVY